MNCPLCLTTAKYFTTGENRQYFLCGLCELIFVPPEFHVPAESERDRYLEHENSLESEGYVAMFMDKINLVKKHCPQIKTALDFGCGYEPVLKTILEREGIETEIYDLNFFPNLPANKTYDLVISTETFEHFKKPKQDIQEVANCVTPSGFLAVMTRFYPLIKENSDEFAKWYYQRDPTHIAFYTSKTFQWIAQDMGFQVVLDNKFDFVLLKKSSLL